MSVHPQKIVDDSVFPTWGFQLIVFKLLSHAASKFARRIRRKMIKYLGKAASSCWVLLPKHYETFIYLSDFFGISCQPPLWPHKLANIMCMCVTCLRLLNWLICYFSNTWILYWLFLPKQRLSVSATKIFSLCLE